MEREYKLVYTVDDTQAVGKLQAIRNNVYMVHAEVTKTIGAMNQWNTTMASFSTAGANAFRQVEAAAGVFSTQVTNGGIAVKTLGQEAGGLLPAWQVFEYGVVLAGKFGESVNGAREHMQKLAKDTIALRDDFRELANLQGFNAPGDEVVGATIQKGMEAGLTPTQARRFMEQFEGSIPAGRQKGNIQGPIEEQLATEGMKFGARVGLNEATAGDITGVLAQYEPITSVAEGAGMLGRIVHGLNEGRGNVEPLMRSLIKTAGAIVEEQGGPVDRLDKLAALLGVASMNATPDRAGTQLVNAIRSLRKTKGSQGEELKRLGITPDMKYTDALEKIAPEITAADKAGAGGDTYLREHGFDNEDEIRALVQQARNLKLVRERVEYATKKEAGSKVIESDRQFLEESRTGIARKLRAGKEARDFLIGQKEELSELARQAGQNMLRDDKRAGGTANAVRRWAKDLGGIAPYFGAKTALQAEQEEAFVANLEQEAAFHGINLSEEFTKKHPNHTIITGPDGHISPKRLNDDPEFIHKMIDRVEEAGGKPWGKNGLPWVKLAGVMAEDQDHRDKLAAHRRDAAAAAKEWQGAPGGAGAGAGWGAPGAPNMAGVEQRLDKIARQNEEANRLRERARGMFGGGAGPIAPGRK